MSEITRGLSNVEAKQLGLGVFTLSAGPLVPGERSERAAVIAQLLNVKGFAVDTSAGISLEANAALVLVNAALGKNDKSLIDQETIAALISLPNSTRFSLFDLESLVKPRIDQAWSAIPAKVDINGKTASVIEAFSKADPVFDLFRKGGAISVNEFLSRANSSENYSAASSLIRVAFEKSAKPLGPELLEFKDALSGNKSNLIINGKIMALLEDAYPALMVDPQSFGAGDNSIKTIFLALTLKDRSSQENAPVTYAPILKQALFNHFSAKTAANDANLAMLFNSFFSF